LLLAIFPAQFSDQLITSIGIIETMSVYESRFCDVDEAFAVAEGDGDKSLAWWREAHWRFFSDECRELDIKPAETMLLLLERFKVVYR
jgi:uncharacterized protein YhfF